MNGQKGNKNVVGVYTLHSDLRWVPEPQLWSEPQVSLDAALFP